MVNVWSKGMPLCGPYMIRVVCPSERGNNFHNTVQTPNNGLEPALFLLEPKTHTKSNKFNHVFSSASIWITNRGILQIHASSRASLYSFDSMGDEFSVVQPTWIGWCTTKVGLSFTPWVYIRPSSQHLWTNCVAQSWLGCNLQLILFLCSTLQLDQLSTTNKNRNISALDYSWLGIKTVVASNRIFHHLIPSQSRDM